MHTHINCLNSILAVLLHMTIEKVDLSGLLFEGSFVRDQLSLFLHHVDPLVPVATLDHGVFSLLDRL